MRQARVPLPGTCQASGTRGRATLVRSMHGKNHERESRIAYKSEFGQETELILSHNKKVPARPTLACAPPAARDALASGASFETADTRDENPHLSARIRERDRRSSQKRRSYDSALEQRHGMRAASLGVHGPPRASSPADSSVLHGEDLLLPRGHQPANLILVLLYCLLYVVLVVLDQILANGLLHLLDLVQRALADVAQRHLAVLP